MLRKFLERIAECNSKDEACEKVFYGEDGIDMAFQKGKISWKDSELLLKIINKMK